MGWMVRGLIGFSILGVAFWAVLPAANALRNLNASPKVEARFKPQDARVVLPNASWPRNRVSFVRTRTCRNLTPSRLKLEVARNQDPAFRTVRPLPCTRG